MEPDDDYLRGVALLNLGRYYEAHEALEDAWRASSAPSKLIMQGIVQIAVAMHHQSTGNFRGARSVLARAIRNLGQAEQGFGGLDMDDLRGQLTAWLAALQSDSRCEPVQLRWLAPPL